jgi:hypothetical protein
MRDVRERIIISGGRRYYWYAGPFNDVIDAHDYLAAELARGEISEADADAATITESSIFLPVAERPNEKRPGHVILADYVERIAYRYRCRLRQSQSVLVQALAGSSSGCP